MLQIYNCPGSYKVYVFLPGRSFGAHRNGSGQRIPDRPQHGATVLRQLEVPSLIACASCLVRMAQLCSWGVVPRSAATPSMLSPWRLPWVAGLIAVTTFGAGCFCLPVAWYRH